MPITKATTSDLQDIVTLWETISYNEFANYIGKTNVDYFIQSGELQQETEICLPNTYVYKRDNELVGFIVILDNLIELLIVKPKFQNKLIGKQLYKFVLEIIKNKYDVFYIECFDKNERINSICKRLGFTLVDTYTDEMGFVTHKYSYSF